MGRAVVTTCVALALVGAALPLDPVATAGETSAPAPEAAYRLGDRLRAAPATQDVDGYQIVNWEALLPNGWNPNKLLEEMKLGELQDNDPRAREVMRKIAETWKAAPVNTELNRRRIRIAGFIVPLERDRERLRDFLLVPYFGACLHLPPPPANQIVHVIVPRAQNTVEITNAAWVSGVLEVERGETGMAATAYRMIADVVEPFRREWAPF